MKLYEAVRAYAALLELSNQAMDAKSAYAILKAKKQLKVSAEFYLERERKLIETYADQDEKGKPVYIDRANVRISDPQRMQAYNDERKELNELDAEVEIQQRKARAPEHITPAQLEALEGVVAFEEEEEAG